MAQYIAKDYDSPTHATEGVRERVLVGGEWKWRAKTACGRTITGRSGGTSWIQCRVCQRVMAAQDR